MTSKGEDTDWTSTITAVEPADKKSRTRAITNSKLLIVQADASRKWRCTNGNGVLVSDGFYLDCRYPSPFFEFFGCQLVEFLTDYLAKPAFKSW
jgi:hypothetical protein